MVLSGAIMSNIYQIVKSKIHENLLTSPDVADILNVSRERIRQLINSKVLPTKYIFNKNSIRKQYIFNKNTIEEYVKNGKVDWYEPEEIDLLSIPELNNILHCPKRWVYDTTRQGKLIPEMVIGKNNRMIFLYDMISVQEVFMNKGSRGAEKGQRNSTIKLINDIKKLHQQGLNDSQIANKLEKKQPFISKLRKEAGLESLCSRGRPRFATDKIIVNPIMKEIPF
jgi:predicted XRE-type DNA-binding protein